jgi:hypothetical protein
MHRSIRVSVLLGAAVVGSLAARSAKADTITAELVGLNPDTFGNVFLQGAGSLYSGVGNILWQGASSNTAPYNGAFNTYCIDLIQNISFGNTYTFVEAPLISGPKAGAYLSGTPTTGMGAAKAAAIEEMYGQNLSTTIGNTQAAADASEGFQLAVWNIIYDSDASVSTGSGVFYATSNIAPNAVADANLFLSDAFNTADQALYPVNDLVALIGQDGAQDQVGINPLVTTSVGVPLPTSIFGGTVLMSCLAAVRWKRRRLLRQTV